MRNSLRSGLLATICAGSMLVGGCGGKKDDVTYLTRNEFEWNVGNESVDVYNYIHGDSVSDDLELNSGLNYDLSGDSLVGVQNDSGNGFYLVSDVPIENLRSTKYSIKSYGAIGGSKAREILGIARSNPNNSGFKPKYVYKISDEDGHLYSYQSRGTTKSGINVIIEGDVKEKYVGVVPILCVSYSQRKNTNSGFRKKEKIFCGPIKKLDN